MNDCGKFKVQMSECNFTYAKFTGQFNIRNFMKLSNPKSEIAK